ncbi:unnamed protein product [Closterium sp. Naga37s-1]|nr:unnamed protein product [Closterium sp. Naga37s-1]
MVAHQESSAVSAAAFVASTVPNGVSAKGVLAKSYESDGPVANGVTIANAVANVENAFNELKKTIVNVGADSIVPVEGKNNKSEKVDEEKESETEKAENGKENDAETMEDDEDYEEEEEEQYEYPYVVDSAFPSVFPPFLPVIHPSCLSVLPPSHTKPLHFPFPSHLIHRICLVPSTLFARPILALASPSFSSRFSLRPFPLPILSHIPPLPRFSPLLPPLPHPPSPFPQPSPSPSLSPQVDPPPSLPRAPNRKAPLQLRAAAFPPPDLRTAMKDGWWRKKEYICNELAINSAIVSPDHGDVVALEGGAGRQVVTMKGYAYSGGGRRVTRVEITLDGGSTWRLCDITHPSPPTRHGKHWTWSLWATEVPVIDLVGASEVAVRAWDDATNTQPDKLTWNVMGMMNNCWFRVRVAPTVTPEGSIGLQFIHPTRPGNLPGGWMVYDCTKFLKDHPGGSESITINAGTDVTEEFDAIHSEKAKKMLEEYYIGDVAGEGEEEGPSAAAAVTVPAATPAPTPLPASPTALHPTTLDPKKRISVPLLSKVSLSPDVRRFRFALPSANHILGLPVGKHLFVCAKVGGKLVMRAYTPTTSDEDGVGYFDLVVKVYFKGVVPQFPDGGVMSQHLESLSVGDTIEIKGPLGHIEYLGRGKFLVSGEEKQGKKLAMLAGGTGITPIYQVAKAILADPEDKTEMWVLFGNRSVADVLLQDEMDRWVEQYPGRFHVWYTICEPVPEGWKYGIGFVTAAMANERLPRGGEDSLALMCGPPPMIRAMTPLLEGMGYSSDRLLTF